MVSLERKSQVLRTFGISKSTLHNRIKAGLFTPPVLIGVRAVAWPSNEIESLTAAQIAGKSEDEIRLLVTVLLEKRIQGGG
jgi:prophage regulatory protein